MEDRKIRIMRKALKMYGVEDEEKQNSFMSDLTDIDKEEPQDNSSDANAGQTPANQSAEDKTANTVQNKANDGVEDEKNKQGVENKENPQANGNGQATATTTTPIPQPATKVENDNGIKELQGEIASLKSQIASVQGMLRDLSTDDADSDGYDDGSRLGGNKIVPAKAKDEDTDGQDLVAKLGGGKY